jgi:hypothetical protein
MYTHTHSEQLLKSNLNTPWYSRLASMCGVYVRKSPPTNAVDAKIAKSV